MWSIHTIEYHSAVSKDEILSLGTTWTDLENNMLSKISQTEVRNSIVSLICTRYSFTHIKPKAANDK